MSTPARLFIIEEMRIIGQEKHIKSVAKNNELSLALGFKLQKYVYTNMVKRLNNAYTDQQSNLLIFVLFTFKRSLMKT